MNKDNSKTSTLSVIEEYVDLWRMLSLAYGSDKKEMRECWRTLVLYNENFRSNPNLTKTLQRLSAHKRSRKKQSAGGNVVRFLPKAA
jgi:hypothetical protein